MLDRLKSRLRRSLSLFSFRYRGDALQCRICNRRFGRFRDLEATYWLRNERVDHFTANCLCPSCGSNIRHRLLAEIFTSWAPRLPAGARLLHFAPEEGFAGFLRRHAIEYVAADLHPRPGSDVLRLDMTSLELADASFDAVVAIHVLEHIREDRKAMAELFRILRPGGMAFIAVPTYGDHSYEDPSLDAEGRTRMFGIDEHLRLYGLDLAAKLNETGFVTTTLSLEDVPGDYIDRSVSSPHVDSNRYAFICLKP